MKYIKGKKFKKELKAFSLLELMVALALGIIVITFVVRAGGSFYRKSLETKALLDMQDTISFTRYTMGNAMKQLHTGSCDSLLEEINLGRLQIIQSPTRRFTGGMINSSGAASGGVPTVNNRAFSLYIGRVGTPTTITTGVGRPDNNTGIFPTFPGTDTPAPNSAVSGTDFLVVLEVGPRLLVNEIVSDSRAKTSTISDNDILTYFPGNINYARWGSIMISDCSITQITNVTHLSASSAGVDTFNIIGSTSNFNSTFKPSSADEIFLAPFHYRVYFIGYDENLNVGLREIIYNANNATFDPARARTIVDGISDMQITTANSDGADTNPIQTFFATTNRAIPGGGNYNTFTDTNQFNQIQSLNITYTVSPNDAGIFGRTSDGETTDNSFSKTFTETYTLRNE